MSHEFQIQAQEQWLLRQSTCIITPLVQGVCHTLDAVQLQPQQDVICVDILLWMDIALPEQQVSQHNCISTSTRAGARLLPCFALSLALQPHGALHL